MKISAKSKYSLLLLIDLAQHYDEDYVSLTDVAFRKKISKKYLEQIVTILHRTGFIESIRGSKGGYRLVDVPENITVQEVLAVTEIFFEPSKPTINTHILALDPLVIDGLKEVMDNYLKGITIKDLVIKLDAYYADNYSI